jgi:hypothetical protein
VLGTAAADQKSVEWSLSETLRTRLHVGKAIPIARPEALSQQLRTAGQQTTFIVTDATALTTALSAGGWKDLVERRFEVVTPRLWGRVLYVFTRPGERDRTPQPQARQGWVYWADTSEGSESIGERTSRLVQRFGLGNVKFSSLISARAMAQGLIDGSIDVVCVYEEEPSGFLARLLIELEASQQKFDRLAIKADAQDAAVSVLDGVALLTLPLEGQRFYVIPGNISESPATAASGTSVVVTPPASPPRSGFQLPIVLTNARATGELVRLEQALNRPLPTFVHQQYLRALFELSISRCSTSDPVAAEHFKTLLLSMFFSDRKNAYTALGLLGHLDYMRGVREAAARATATPDRRAALAGSYLPERVFERILTTENEDLESTGAADLVKWLRAHSTPAPRLTTDLRARYAGHTSEGKYVAAVEDLHKALGETRPAEQKALLEAARGAFFELAEVARPEGCGRRIVQRGLWTGADFEPFFYLVIIDAVLRETATAQ